MCVVVLTLRHRLDQSPSMRILLASSSPRRQALLRAAQFDFTVVSPDVDETALAGESPRALVERLASCKAHAVKDENVDVIIAADTIVTIDGTVLGKPADHGECTHFLQKLSGRTHQVMTGVCVLHQQGTETLSRLQVVVTDVTFRTLSSAQIAFYVNSGEGLDKAGAYAIQGLGAMLIDRIEGSYTNVIGLPLAELLTMITKIR